MLDPQEDQVPVTIPWRRWTPEAFQEALATQRVILLDISATWCHWCHVMDASTYADPEVIRRVVQDTIPVRVDADRRPDINNRYNMGGWPSTALLTPEGDLISGGTYMPPAEFLETLDRVVAYYRDERADITQKIERRKARRARIAELRHRLRHDVTPEIVDRITQALLETYDQRYGGFGDQMKFPLPDAVEMAMAVGSAGRDQALLDIASTTLTAMAEGGLHDSVGGGFFRYATRADWSEPHYEKLLEGNARLLATYLQGVQLFDDPAYAKAAYGIVEFALTRLREGELGAFGGSANADPEYYHLRADARAERNAPAVDPTLFTDGNAMLVSALLQVAATLDRPELADVALATLESIWQRNFVPDAGMTHYYDGAAHVVGLIGDQVWMGHALLDAQTYAGKGDYQQRAAELVRIMRARLLDPDAGGFYDLPYDPAALARLDTRHKLLAENAYAADLALRLHRLTGDGNMHELAIGTLEAMAPLYPTYRQHAAAYGLAVFRYTNPYHHIVVVGDPAAGEAQALRFAAWRFYDPNRIVESVDPVSQPGRLHTLNLPATPQPALYILRGKAVSGPIQDPMAVRQAVQGVLA